MSQPRAVRQGSGELSSGGVQVGVGINTSVNTLTPAEECILAEHRRCEAMNDEERAAELEGLETEIARVKAELKRYGGRPTKCLNGS